MCLARGRPFTVPLTRLIKDCRDWPESELADPQDGQPVSIAVMRKDLVGCTRETSLQRLTAAGWPLEPRSFAL